MLANFARFVTALGSSMSVSYAILGKLFKELMKTLFTPIWLMFGSNFSGNFFPDNIAFAVVNNIIEKKLSKIVKSYYLF